MSRRPTLIEICVDADLNLSVYRDRERLPTASGAVSLEELDEAQCLADNLHTESFRSVEAYEEAELAAGRALCKILDSAGAAPTPSAIVDTVLKVGLTARVVLDFEHPKLDAMPWELASPPQGRISVPWGAHPRLWLSRRTKRRRDGGVPAASDAGPPARKGTSALLVSTRGGHYEPVVGDLERILASVRSIAGDDFEATLVPAPNKNGSPSADGLDGIRRPINMYHYFGHGIPAAGSEQQHYQFGDRSVSAVDLKASLDGIAGAAELYVIFACHSEDCVESSTTQRGPGFEVVAQEGAPVVVATQAWVSILSAPATTSLLYAFLAKGQPVDQAAMNVRRLMRRVQIGLIAERAYHGHERCDCVYTWRQLTVICSDHNSLKGLPPFADARHTAEDALEFKQVWDMYERLRISKSALMAEPPPDNDCMVPMGVFTEKELSALFPRTSSLLAPYLLNKKCALKRGRCVDWHVFESLKLTLVAAGAFLRNDELLEEMVR